MKFVERDLAHALAPPSSQLMVLTLERELPPNVSCIEMKTEVCGSMVFEAQELQAKSVFSLVFNGEIRFSSSNQPLNTG